MNITRILAIQKYGWRYPKFYLSAGLLIKAENAMDTPLFSRKFLFSLADLALP
jgi:hypothetical protein